MALAELLTRPATALLLIWECSTQAQDAVIDRVKQRLHPPMDVYGLMDNMYASCRLLDQLTAQVHDRRFSVSSACLCIYSPYLEKNEVLCAWVLKCFSTGLASVLATEAHLHNSIQTTAGSWKTIAMDREVYSKGWTGLEDYRRDLKSVNK